MAVAGRDGSGDRGRLFGYGFDSARGLLGELMSPPRLVSGRRSGGYPLAVAVTVVVVLIVAGDIMRGPVRVVES
jgi:hypothetical protein